MTQRPSNCTTFCAALAAMLAAGGLLLAGCGSGGAKDDAAGRSAAPLAAGHGGAATVDTASLEKTPWFDSVTKRIVADELRFTGEGGRFHAVSRAHNLRALVAGGGAIAVEPRDKGAADAAWEALLVTTGFGRAGGVARCAAAAPRLGACAGAAVGTDGACVRRLEIEREGFVEWLDNTVAGLEQGFDVGRAPAGDGPLAIEVTVTGLSLRAGAAGSTVVLSAGAKDVLWYGGLAAWDAEGRALPARMEVRGDVVRLVVDDAGAAYPVRVDPLLTAAAWTNEPNQADASYGYTVSAAGDVNNDGYGDVVVGAPLFDGGQTDEGRAYVFHGSASGLPSVASWSDESDVAGAKFGWSVSNAGDINGGDGYADVVIGAPNYGNGQADEGRVYVYNGSSAGLSTTPDWTWESNRGGAQAGFSVSGAGDVNGDGYADVIVGAPYDDNGQADEGFVYGFLGSPGGFASTPNWSAEINLGSALLGKAVSGAGDVNGDGYADVIVGAPGYQSGSTNEGRAYLFLGIAGSVGLAASPSWGYEPNVIGAQLGSSVAAAGDVNGDGYADVIVGAPYDENGQTDEGRAYVFHGIAGTVGLPASPSWAGESNLVSVRYGASVAGAGDVNGDGYADVVVGIPDLTSGQASEGGAVLHYGSSTGLAAAAGWAVESNQTNTNFGAAVSSAGDVNGDGYDDVIVGAPGWDNGETNEGRAYVYQGSATGLAATAVWNTESNQEAGRLGFSLASAGDVNGDGLGDVIVGAPGYDNGQTDEGRAYAYHGTTTGLSMTVSWTAEGNQNYAAFGFSVGGLGDVNGDGYGDVIVGSPLYDNGQTDEGRAFVFLGSAAGLGAAASWTGESNVTNARFGHAVAGAGDVNGDGFADIAVGAPALTNGQSEEGAAYVYLGITGTVGVGASPAWTVESNKSPAMYGTAVAGAGDLNGDGYSDVAVGAPQYENGQANEGRVYVYHGAAGGLSTTPARIVEVDAAEGKLGYAVSSAGDVNGDAYSDLVVGAPYHSNGETEEGRVYVFHGSASGIGATPAWKVESDQASAHLGWSVSNAGNVNGDAYGDVIVGAEAYNNGHANEGMVFVYLGSPSGLASTPAWSADSNQGDAHLGQAVSGAGDVNGDGYSDVIAGSDQYDFGEANEGRAFLWLGNGGVGRNYRPRQTRVSSAVPMQPMSFSDAVDSVKLTLFSRSIWGRQKARIQWEIKPKGVPFNGAGLGLSTTWTDTTLAGADIVHPVGALAGGDSYHWRARVLYQRVNAVGGGWSPWMVFDRRGDLVPDFRLKKTNGSPCSQGFECFSGNCISGVCCASTTCDDLNPCTVDSCATGTCSWTAGNAGTVCRASAGICDVEEACTGAATACPSNSFRTGSTVCRLAAGVCDSDEVCTGGTSVCPVDAYRSSSITCRAVWGVCDVEEKCSGAAVTCPGDSFKTAGNLCRAVAGVCDVAESCTGATAHCANDTFGATSVACRTALGVCDIVEYCPGVSAHCSSNGYAAPDAVCRTAAGSCDAVELCPGTTYACPANLYGGTTQLCRAADGVCDVEEYCAGGTIGCGANLYRASSVVCRAVGGVCDLEERCSGAAVACPADTFKNVSNTCRAAAGICDVVEYCNGSLAACPTDQFGAAIQECRSSTGVCDPAELCTGSAAACPPALLAGTERTCRSATGICDAAEVCAGTAGTCPADLLRPTTQVCRTAVGGCDFAETCTGTTGTCPGDRLRTSGEECRGAAGACDEAEVCNGTSMACPDDLLGTTAKVCRTAMGACDETERCDGTGTACPANAYRPSTSVCRGAVGVCDLAEVCTGSTFSCPPERYYATEFTCRDAVGVCDSAEACSGTSATCPRDNLAPAGTLCRAQSDLCDAEETCTSTSAVCPSDDLLPAGVVCRASTGTCDLQEACDGTSDLCPADNSSTLNGTSCNDGNEWTENDVCQNGACVGTEEGDCATPIEITTLPYSYSNSTEGRASHLDAYGSGCPGAAGTSGDVVYELTVEAGRSYQVTVTPATGFNATVAVIATCADGQDCIAGADDGGENAPETVTFTAAASGTVVIVVDGSGSSETGDFDLAVVETTGVEEGAEAEDAEAADDIEEGAEAGEGAEDAASDAKDGAEGDGGEVAGDGQADTAQEGGGGSKGCGCELVG